MGKDRGDQRGNGRVRRPVAPGKGRRVRKSQPDTAGRRLRPNLAARPFFYAWLGLGLFILVLFLYLKPEPQWALLSDSQKSPFYYLLNAGSQALAAILGLAITLALVVAQFATRYGPSPIERIMLKPWTLSYLLLSLVAILLSLAAMARPFPYAIHLSLVLSAACLVFLAPFLLYLARVISPQQLVQDLAEEGKKSLAFRAVPQIAVLDNIALSAYILKDYEIVERSLKALSALAAAIPRDAPSGIRSPLSFEDITARLRDVALATLDDPRTPLRALSALGEAGVAAVEKGLDGGVLEVALALERVGEAAAEKGLNDAPWQAAWVLERVGVAAAAKGRDEAADACAGALGRLGEAAAGRGFETAAARAALALGRVGGAAAAHGLDGASYQAARDLRQLGAAAASRGLTTAGERAATGLWQLGSRANSERVRRCAREGLLALTERWPDAVAEGFEEAAEDGSPDERNTLGAFRSFVEAAAR